MKEISDILVIGSGPVGLFTAFYGGMREAKVDVIDSMPHVGGQLSALYPEKYIHDVAGFPKIKAQELVDKLYEQAKTFNPNFILDESVLEVIRKEDGTFEVKTSRSAYQTKSIIITAGAGAFQPRKLNIKQETQYQENISYFVKDIDKYRGKRVMICGGGDSAVDWALELEAIAKEVTLVHRREKLRAHESSVTKLMDSTVNLTTPYVIKDINGEGPLLNVKIEDAKTQDCQLVSAEEIIVNYGFVTSLGPIKEWELEIERNSIVVNQQMETNIKGIYAAGDVCTYEGKPKLIATGFGETTMAVNQAKLMLDPKARINVHSTHLFADKEKQKVAVTTDA